MKLSKIILILIFTSVTLFSSCGENVHHVFTVPQDQFIDVVQPFSDVETSSSKNWGLDAINLEQALKISKSDRTVIVAVIDTGLDINHQDIKSNIWISSEGDSFGDSTDVVGHGTHVSGIITSVCEASSIIFLTP